MTKNALNPVTKTEIYLSFKVLSLGPKSRFDPRALSLLFKAITKKQQLQHQNTG